MRILALTAIAASALLISCSDDPTTPTVVGSYVRPAGSYEIHSNVDIAIDAATGKTTEVAAPDDSTVIVQRTSTDGVDKSVAHVYESGVIVDTLELAQNGSVLTSNQFLIKLELPGTVLNFGRRQVTIADFSKSSWTALKDTILPFDYPTLPGVKLSGSLNFVGKSLGDENLIIDGKTYATKKVQIDLNSVITASVSVSVPVNLVRTVWLADRVGIVKVEQKPAIIDLGSAGALLGIQKLAVPGFIQTDKRWSEGN